MKEIALFQECTEQYLQNLKPLTLIRFASIWSARTINSLIVTLIHH